MRDNQNTTKAQRYVTQLGKTVINQAHYHAGVMFGYAKQSSKTRSSRVGTSRGKVQGYALGVYGTWYQTQMMTPAYTLTVGYNINGSKIK